MKKKVRNKCTEEKVSWTDYVSIFRTENPEISDDFYGKWIQVIKEDVSKRPCEKDFNLPSTKEECDQMIFIVENRAMTVQYNTFCAIYNIETRDRTTRKFIEKE